MNKNLTLSRFFISIKRGILEIVLFSLMFFALGEGLASFYVDTEYSSSGEIQLGEGINTIHPSNVQAILLSTAVMNETVKALNAAEVTHFDGTQITLRDLEGHFTSSIDPISVKVTYTNLDHTITYQVMDTFLKEGKEYLDAKYPVYKVIISKEASEVVENKQNKTETILFCTLIGLMIGFVTAIIREALSDRIYSKKEISDIKLNVIDVYSQSKKMVFYPFQKRALQCSTDSIIEFKNNLQLATLQESKIITLLTPRNSLHTAEFAKELSTIISSYYQEKTLLLGLDFTSSNLIKLFDIKEDSNEYKTYTDGESQIIKLNENLDVALYPLSKASSKYIVNNNFDNFMNDAKEKYQHIIIITSPVLKSYDHMALIKHSNINLLLIKKDETIRKDIYDSLDILEKRTITPNALIYVDALRNLKVLLHIIKSPFKKLFKKK